MIDEEATKETFGYYSFDLSPESGKFVLAFCDNCCIERITSKHSYRSLCKSCALKGQNGQKGHNWRGGSIKCICKTCGKEFCIRSSVIKYGGGKFCCRSCYAKSLEGRTGEEHPNFKGGKKLARSRSSAKRKRQLGYTLLLPLQDGEVGHHVTNEYVIGVPEEVHQSFGGLRRKRHRTLVLQWLKANDKKKYKLALCVLAKDPFLF